MMNAAGITVTVKMAGAHCIGRGIIAISLLNIKVLPSSLKKNSERRNSWLF